MDCCAKLQKPQGKSIVTGPIDRDSDESYEKGYKYVDHVARQKPKFNRIPSQATFFAPGVQILSSPF